MHDFDSDARNWVTWVGSRDEVSPELAVAWRIAPDGRPVETDYSVRPVGDVDVLGRTFRADLTRIGVCIADRGLTLTLTVPLLSVGFPLGDDEGLMEYTNRPAGIQLATVVSRAEVDDRLAARWRVTDDCLPVAHGYCPEAQKGKGGFHGEQGGGQGDGQGGQGDGQGGSGESDK